MNLRTGRIRKLEWIIPTLNLMVMLLLASNVQSVKSYQDTEHHLTIPETFCPKNVMNDTISYFTIIVRNYGDFNETFDVSCYYDSYLIGTKTVGPGNPFQSLEPGEDIAIPFRWDTTPVPLGNYTINVSVSNQFIDLTANIISVFEVFLGDIVPDRTINIIDVSLAASFFGASTIAEDIDLDGVVDFVDIAIVLWAINTVPGQPLWNPDADLDNSNTVTTKDFGTVTLQKGFISSPRYLPNPDLNNDGAINIVDLATIALHFGESY